MPKLVRAPTALRGAADVFIAIIREENVAGGSSTFLFAVAINRRIGLHQFRFVAEHDRIEPVLNRRPCAAFNPLPMTIASVRKQTHRYPRRFDVLERRKNRQVRFEDRTDRFEHLVNGKLCSKLPIELAGELFVSEQSCFRSESLGLNQRERTGLIKRASSQSCELFGGNFVIESDQDVTEIKVNKRVAHEAVPEFTSSCFQ